MYMNLIPHYRLVICAQTVDVTKINHWKARTGQSSLSPSWHPSPEGTPSAYNQTEIKLAIVLCVQALGVLLKPLIL